MEGVHLGSLGYYSGDQRRQRSQEDLWLQVLKWGTKGSSPATGGGEKEKWENDGWEGRSVILPRGRKEGEWVSSRGSLGTSLPEKVLLVIKKWGKGTADTEGEALNSTGHFFLSALRRKNPNVHVVGIKKAKHSVAFGPL